MYASDSGWQDCDWYVQKIERSGYEVISINMNHKHESRYYAHADVLTDHAATIRPMSERFIELERFQDSRVCVLVVLVCVHVRCSQGTPLLSQQEEAFVQYMPPSATS